MRLQLPHINARAERYMLRAAARDRCSCFPDNLHGVFIGHLCLRHDERYEWIWRQRFHSGPWWLAPLDALIGWLIRLALKWMADVELAQGVREEFAAKGADKSLIPWWMCAGVIFLNIYFRVAKALWNAIWFKG